MLSNLFAERTLGLISINGWESYPQTKSSTYSQLHPSSFVDQDNTPQLHGCKGIGGKNCGCGGKCTGDNNVNLIKSELTDTFKIPTLEEITQLKALIHPSVYQDQILKNSPGNSSL